MNILILTKKFGMGHYSVSYSLEQQIKEKFPYATITIIDFFQFALPKTAKLLYQSFTLMVNRASACYNLYYKLSDHPKSETKPFYSDYLLKSLSHLVGEQVPTFIISTFPLCSQLVSLYKEKNKSSLPLMTCITDISTHSEWIHPHTNCYLVASQSIQQVLIQKGIASHQIEVIGIPVKAEFREKSAKEFKTTSSLEKNILIMGGGLGLLPKTESFYQSLNALPYVKTTVITGKNKKLYQMLHGKYKNIEVIGFTDKVYKYMQQADLIVSKPGGITVFEAIHSELPILVMEPFLQQEINNAHFIFHHQVGTIMTKKHFKDADYIHDLIYDDSTLAQMRLNMRRLKQQINHDAIERFILRLQTQELGEYAS